MESILEFKNLYQGNYTLKEIEANSNYILNDKTFDITTEFNKTSEITIENEHKKGNLKVYKIDKDNNEVKLEGVEFEIYEKTEVTIKTKAGEHGRLFGAITAADIAEQFGLEAKSITGTINAGLIRPKTLWPFPEKAFDLIGDDVKKVIRDCFDLGPLHNPVNLVGIEACEAALPAGSPKRTAPQPFVFPHCRINMWHTSAVFP